MRCQIANEARSAELAIIKQSHIQQAQMEYLFY